MNKSVARGIARPVVGHPLYAAADAHLIRVGFNPGRIKNNLRKASRPIY